MAFTTPEEFQNDNKIMEGNLDELQAVVKIIGCMAENMVKKTIQKVVVRTVGRRQYMRGAKLLTRGALEMARSMGKTVEQYANEFEMSDEEQKLADTVFPKPAVYDHVAYVRATNEHVSRGCVQCTISALVQPATGCPAHPFPQIEDFFKKS